VYGWSKISVAAEMAYVLEQRGQPYALLPGSRGSGRQKADPARKAKIYAGLGLRLAYHPDKRRSWSDRHPHRV
jgi:hypothetical protein